MKTERIQALRTKLEALKIDAILIGSHANIAYLSGFTGSNGMLYISKTSHKLITDFRYMEQAAQQAPQYEIVNQGSLGLIKSAIESALVEKIEHIGFESVHTNYSTFKGFEAFEGIAFVPTEGVVESLRRIKDADEVAKIKKAESIGDLAFAKIISFLTEGHRHGLTETEVALEIERTMRMNGASGNSFSPIVAAGAKSSLCHAMPGADTFHHGDFVVMDFGCVYEGYCSDMTRTVVIGEASPKHLEIYGVVLKAQEAALAAIKPGMVCKEIDKIARDIITEAGYGEYFGHGLGHSLGVEIHENPRFSASDDTVLEVGMVLTVEPGIYVPGFGGVRIEDVIVVTETGIENLTSSPKGLITIK
ncbi:MAG: M24 family metallopeptidase [Cellulosilyticaceae bacterium]